VTAIGSAPTFFAGLLGINQMTASALAGGGFSPLDIVLVLDRSGSMDDDNCDLRSYCKSSDPHDTSSCAQCVGAWSNGTCNINPFPARCGALTQTNCQNCRGIWDTANPPQPITDARAAAASFVDRNNPRLSRLSVVSYSTAASVNRTLTNDLQAVKNAVNSVGQPYPTGCTNAADGIKKAREELLGTRKRNNAVRFIIFLTDGLPNYPQCPSCPSTPNGCPAAMTAVRTEAGIASQNAIVIYTIGLGTSTDKALLADVASLTGGEFFYAPSSSDLIAIYAAIFEKIKLRLVQ
jgi:Mg-chelatase subunit ChlD